jgi:hypothetical protein
MNTRETSYGDEERRLKILHLQFSTDCSQVRFKEPQRAPQRPNEPKATPQNLLRIDFRPGDLPPILA